MARPPTPMAIPSGSPNAITKGLPSVSSAHGPFFALMSGARSPESFLSRASANHLETDPLKPASSRSCRSAWSSCHRLQPSQQPTAIRNADSPHKPSTGVSTGTKASLAQASFVQWNTRPCCLSRSSRSDSRRRRGAPWQNAQTAGNAPALGEPALSMLPTGYALRTSTYL